jgi:hypothetical protein
MEVQMKFFKQKLLIIFTLSAVFCNGLGLTNGNASPLERERLLDGGGSDSKIQLKVRWLEEKSDIGRKIIVFVRNSGKTTLLNKEMIFNIKGKNTDEVASGKIQLSLSPGQEVGLPILLRDPQIQSDAFFGMSIPLSQPIHEIESVDISFGSLNFSSLDEDKSILKTAQTQSKTLGAARTRTTENSNNIVPFLLTIAGALGCSIILIVRWFRWQRQLSTYSQVLKNQTITPRSLRSIYDAANLAPHKLQINQQNTFSL